MDDTQSLTTANTENDELKRIEALSLTKISTYLSDDPEKNSLGVTTTTVAEETLKAAVVVTRRSHSSSIEQQPILEPKKSARIANSSSRYKKLHLLVGGGGVTTKRATPPSTPVPVPVPIQTPIGKIKLGFNLVLSKTRNRSRLSDEAAAVSSSRNEQDEVAELNEEETTNPDEQMSRKSRISSGRRLFYEIFCC